MGLLDGKYALVTGGASGIGAAICKELAREGANVVIADINADDGATLCRALSETGSKAEFVRCDVTQSNSVSEAIKLPEKLDCVVNCAGIAGPICDIRQVTEKDFNKVMEINVKGTFLVMQAAISRMRNDGGGAIVNLASVGGVVGTPNLTPYTMSKHAVVGLTRGAAVEQAPFGIRINAVCPGPTRTRMIENAARDMQTSAQDMGLDLPLGRINEPEDVANAVVWLCSDKSAASVGALVMIDGGYTAQ